MRTISETHKFDKDKLIAINTSDVENGVMGNGTLTFVDELKGQFKKTIVKDDYLIQLPYALHFVQCIGRLFYCT